MKPVLRVIDDHPLRPIGFIAINRCDVCHIECKAGKARHYRCDAMLKRQADRAAQMPLALHMAQVAGEYVRARL